MESKMRRWWESYDGKAVFVQFRQPAVVVRGNMEPLVGQEGPAMVQGIRGILSVALETDGAWLTLRFADPSSTKDGAEMLVTLHEREVAFIYVGQQRSVLHAP
jgi:hypothetical protein